jgi:hypothetical protein
MIPPRHAQIDQLDRYYSYTIIFIYTVIPYIAYAEALSSELN